MSIQLLTSWRPDFLSFFIGLLLGLMLALVYQKWLHAYFFDGWTTVISGFKTQRAWLGNSSEDRFRADMATYVQARHLGSIWATLDKIFVEPRLFVPLTDQTFCSSPADASRLYYLWPELAARAAVTPPPSVSLRQMLRRGQWIALTGEPGAGKTSLLAYITYLYAQGDKSTERLDFGHEDIKRRLPIFVHIAELELNQICESEAEPPSDADPLQPLLMALLKRPKVLGRRGLNRLIQGNAKSGRLLLLLDGYDEIPKNDRYAALSWLKLFLSTYPDSQVFVASPTRGSGSLIELGFIISEIMPWRIGQATKLANMWKETIRSGEQFDLKSYWQPGQLALETTQRLQLALNPDKNDPMDPPRDWSRMFEALFRQMLFRIARDPEGAWLAPAARELWQKMAYQILTKPSLFMTEDELTLLIEDILVHFNQKVGSKSIARLKETVTSGDLFVSYGERRFGFLSPVWRDFFATHYLVQVGRENEVLANLKNPSWSGVLRFYVGKVGGEKLVTTLLENGSSPLHEYLFQIASWLPEACDKLAWRKEVLVRLGRLIISDNVPIIWRQRATLALALTEESGVGALLDQLIHQENPELRQVIPAAIAKINKDDAVLSIDRLIEDSNPSVRAAVVHALAWMDEPATEGAVIQAILEPDEPLSWAAAEGLALNGTIDSYAILREAIEDEVLSVRRAAVQGLSLLDESWSLELLKRAAIKDDQPVVKIAANEALQKITQNGEAGKWQAPQPGDQAWLVSWAVEKGRMVPVGEAALPLVLEALEDEEPKVRADAALTLAQVSAPEATDPLMKALKDPDILVRTAAFAALCELDRAWDVNGSLLPTG